MKGSLMFIEVGEKVSVSDLLKGVIIVSGNDASVALAEYVAGSESGFSQMMNRVAVNLDMSNTHFMNASGWPAEDHYSSAQDLAKLDRVFRFACGLRGLPVRLSTPYWNSFCA
jgi:D-alanyl-D-alanine carboxypeptidase (penicillin-binding protein 5/6)